MYVYVCVYIYRDRYIDEVIKFFYKYINKKDGKTIGTKIGNNIRFHYIDPRKYIRNNIYKYIEKTFTKANEDKNK